MTAPSPENLKTLFEFVCKGFDSLEYKVHLFPLLFLSPLLFSIAITLMFYC